jgi:tetratricopeptide (TPR) repeat protein
MRRTLVILSFIAGITFAPLPVRAQGTDAASEQFVEVFLGVKKAEEQEKAGDLKVALAGYRAALITLKKIKQESPNWQTDLLDYRLKTTHDAIERVQGKMGAGAVRPGASEPLGVLPPIQDPLQGDAGAPPPAIPRGKGPKNQPPIGDDNPIAAVQRQMEDYKRQLSEVKDMLREEQEKNAKLTTDITEAMSAKKKAEDARKKAQDLAQVFEASIHELKAAGDANGTRAKELEAKLAAANRASAETQIDLAAAEERISQLLGRVHVVTAKANDAETLVGTLPKQVQSLQAKLEAEQKATAQQSEQAKKREEDLKGQIAALAKDKAESAGAVAEMKSLQAKLDAEQKTSASEAMKAKKREEDLKGQLASLAKERNDAREELVRLRELNKQTDKLMADNAGLLKKLGEAEKQILTFKSAGGSRDTELGALRKQITDTQKALVSSDQKNATMQAEIGELQKKVADYSKQIAQFKADKTASAEERKKMEDENRLLQGIVTRVLQEDANRAQRKKMIQGEIGKLHLQSDALLQQINYLTQPAVKLSASERKLFKKPVFDVQDPNTLVAVKTDSTQPAAEPSVPAKTAEPPKRAVEKTGTTTPPPALPATNEPAPPESAKPPVEMTKPESQPTAVKPKQADDLPVKDPTETKPPEAGATPAVTSVAGAKLPADVRPLAEQAKKAFEGEKFPDSEKLYDKALQMAPNNVYLLSNRAVVQFRQGKFKQSEESFKKALVIAPEDAFCWSTIGIVYYSEQKFDEAVNALTKSLAINPRNPTAHNYLGITAAQKGWLEAAQKELESSIQLDPKYADAWFNLAVTFTLMQPPKLEEAAKAYKKAIELGAEKDPAMEDMLKQQLNK